MGIVRIQDAEFAVLYGGPYDGLKLSREGRGVPSANQIGLPTPQYLHSFMEFTKEKTPKTKIEPIYDIEYSEGSTTEVVSAESFSFNGEETIAVYTDTTKKKKYSEIFDTVPKKLEKLSSVLNVSIFDFSFYAKLKDIEIE